MLFFNVHWHFRTGSIQRHEAHWWRVRSPKSIESLVYGCALIIELILHWFRKLSKEKQEKAMPMGDTMTTFKKIIEGNMMWILNLTMQKNLFSIALSVCTWNRKCSKASPTIFQASTTFKKAFSPRIWLLRWRRLT